MSWSRRDSRIVRSTGVQEPQRVRWLSTQRTETGSAVPSSQSRLRAVARAHQVVVAGTPPRLGLLDPGHHRLDPLGLLRRLRRAGISTTIRSPSR